MAHGGIWLGRVLLGVGTLGVEGGSEERSIIDGHNGVIPRGGGGPKEVGV